MNDSSAVWILIIFVGAVLVLRAVSNARKRMAQADAIKWMAEANPTLIYDSAPSISFKSGESLLGSLPRTTLQLERAVRSGTSESHGELRVADQGTLVVTDQRLTFIGARRTISVPLEKVIGVEAYSDALALHRQGKEKVEFFSLSTDLNVSFQKDGKKLKAPIHPAMVKIIIDHAISVLHGVQPRQIERVYPAVGAQSEIQSGEAGKTAASTGEATIMNLDPKVLKMTQEAASSLRQTKANILRLFAEAHDLTPDLEEFCKNVPPNFDAFMQIVLCRIASADAPLSARETSVINLLLGQSYQINYYRLLLENSKNIDVINSLGGMTDIAMQLAAKEGGGDYDPQADPIVKCFESLGQAVLAADDDADPKELAYFSKITDMLHSNAAKLDGRIKTLVGGSEAAEPSNNKDTSKLDKDAVPQTIEKCIAQLHSLVGLESVKREVETLINVAKVFAIRKQRGLPVPDVSFHMVFSGNPGTGKTSVARVIAQVYGCLGLLKGGQLIEVDRSGLVGNFVGQTATKTKKVIETAIGGVLFIDEAYALANNSDNDFGHEAIETLLKAMEDHRDELVVIVAGYGNKMNAFLASNPGLRSRFPRVISFPDYSRDELCEIFSRTANQNKFVVSESAAAVLRVGFEKLVQNKGPDFANARDVRNIFERAISMQANRIGSLTSIDDVELTAITAQDVNLAVADNGISDHSAAV